MIDKKTRANRLRRHRKLKASTEAQLELAVSDQDRKHLKVRIAEIDRDIVTTKGDSIGERDILPIPIPVADVKPLLPAITKTAEEDAKNPEEHIVQPLKLETPKPKRKIVKVKKVGNPF